jgi:hypothetical protein
LKRLRGSTAGFSPYRQARPGRILPPEDSMKTQAATPVVVSGETAHNPAYQAYQILHVAFVIAPIVAGCDKFLMKLTNWTQYLWPPLGNFLGGPRTFMEIVGAIEIVAGLIVAFKPKIGAYVVAAWLVGIIVNLLLLQNFYDIALRDLGLCLGAIALGRLSVYFDHPRVNP